MFDNMRDWVQSPFNEQMDLLHWTLFIIVVVSVVILWNDVLNSFIPE